VGSVLAFIRLGRPLFLGGGFILFALGAVIARASGHAIDAGRYALGQGAVTAFQLMTHYANDYFDLEADRANATPTKWSGGSRVLPGGELPANVALVAALVLAAIGCVLGGVLIADTDSNIAATLVAMAALAWAYSAPPLRLCARGLGELDTAVVVTVLVPWLGFSLQAPDGPGRDLLVLAIVPLALLQFAMLVAIELPDAAGDAAAGKRTLVVRLGATRAASLYMAAVTLAFLWLPLAWRLGLPSRAAMAGSIPVPIALWRIGRIRADSADVSAYERLTFFAVFLLVATSACELIAFVT
jgi:1,4-dihydroxy-2-naphthoate octaprenyltransferase